MKQRLPNFFIVGAPKAGTTALFRYLSMHPEVFMSSVKEPNFFSFPDIAAQKLYYNVKPVSDWNRYTELFSSANGAKAIGEASVSYLFYPDAAARLHEAFPTARIVIVLRNPVERAWSHYMMDRKLNLVSRSFEDVVTGDKNALHYQQYVKLGLYAKQVETYIRLFGRAKVFIGLHDDMKKDFNAFAENVCCFLDVVPSPFKNGHKYNSAEEPRNRFVRILYGSPARRAFAKKIAGPFVPAVKSLLFRQPEMRPGHAAVGALRELYTPDLQRLEQATGLDLRAWYE
ncbi:MAG TPA: sulfotransferase [Chitinophagales bacterium]|nr:sulfotransferase [Chitinophagales bacterium]